MAMGPLICSFHDLNKNTPMHNPTSIPSISWVADSYSTMSDIQLHTTLYNVKFNSVGEASPLCVVPIVAQNWVPWNPFWCVTNSFLDQNSASYPHSFGPTP